MHLYSSWRLCVEPAIRSVSVSWWFVCRVRELARMMKMNARIAGGHNRVGLLCDGDFGVR